MNQDTMLTLRRRAIGVAVASAVASLASGPALADPVMTARLFKDTDILFRDADMGRWSDNYVELGIGNNTQSGYRFGQFSGLKDKGGFPIAGFNWLSRDPGNDAQYWQVFGSTLGLDSRKLQAEGGVQGSWNASFNYDQLSKALTSPTYFIHNGLGTSNLTLPTGFVPNNAVSGNAANLNAVMKKFDLEQSRNILRIGLSGLASSNWDWKVNFREDKRDGTRLTGLVTSQSKGMLVPYQIDDHTSIVDAILSYNSKLAQFSLGYSYSKFQNNLTSFTVANPFDAGTPTQRLSLAPSNDYHQINATGAYNFAKNTRLTSKFSYSIGRQNDSFLPYSANGAAATAALPRSSLDGKVVKTLLDIALTTKPVDKMSLKVAYQYHHSDNQTPVANYQYASRDGAAIGGTAQSRRNAPLSTQEQIFSLDGDYEIAPKTIVRAGLERKGVKYSMQNALYENHADRDWTNTDKLSMELRRPIGTDVLGNVGYAHTQRRGSEYDKNSYFRNTYWNPGATNNTNNPAIRQFLYQDFDEDRIRASGNWTVSETVTVQAGADTFRRRAADKNCGTIVDANLAAAIAGLPDTCLGRTLADGTNVSLDAQWQPEENLTTFAFYNFGETGTRQRSRQGATANAGGATETAANREWTANLLNRDHTLGLGLKWQPEDLEKWDVGGTYVFNSGVGKASLSTGTGIATAQTNMPDNWNKLHTLQLFAKWDYSKQITWRFNYIYENLKSADWAYDNLTATSDANVLLNGQTAPRSSNHVFGVSAVIKNW